MATYLDPKSGATIGYRETKGTTAEPFFVPMGWQPSSLSYVALKLDSGGNLSTTAGNPTIVPANPATFAATNASSQMLASNVNRTGLVVTNMGNDNAFFGMGVAAVNSSGIALTAGGTWVMDRYTFYSGAINVITPTAATLAIQEYS